MLLVVVIVILLSVVAYLIFTRVPSINEQQQNTSTQTSTSTNASWKEVVYNEFKALSDWTIIDSSDWDIAGIDLSVHDSFRGGKAFVMRRTFNETPNADVQVQEQAGIEAAALQTSVKNTLSADGWKLTASPTEGSAYQSYLYVKDNHPLLLTIGGRNAVSGGMYLAITFQY